MRFDANTIIENYTLLEKNNINPMGLPFNIVCDRENTFFLIGNYDLYEHGLLDCFITDHKLRLTDDFYMVDALNELGIFNDGKERKGCLSASDIIFHWNKTVLSEYLFKLMSKANINSGYIELKGSQFSFL